MNIAPIFPTPIAYFFDFISSKERLQLLDHIKNIPHKSHHCIDGDGSSTHLHQYNFLDEKIKNRIQNALDEYNETCGNVPSRLENAWSNIQNKGSTLLEHTHPDSNVSGALYINVSDSCKLYFHTPNPYVYFTNKKTLTPYNYENQWIGVKNCELVLFPSWLKHGNNRDVCLMDDRIIISFNSR